MPNQVLTVEPAHPKRAPVNDVVATCVTLLISATMLYAINKSALNPIILAFFAGSIVLICAARVRPDDRPLFMTLALWFPVACFAAGPVLTLTQFLEPHTIDKSIDFGIGRAFYLWALGHPHAGFLFTSIYVSLGLGIAAAIALSLQPRLLIKALVAATAIAIPLYMAFPAVGPAFVRTPDAPRNCIPSLHFGWALLLPFYTRGKARCAFSVYAALIAISTLTTGEHYVIDLVAAVALVLFCVWLIPDHATHP